MGGDIIFDFEYYKGIDVIIILFINEWEFYVESEIKWFIDKIVGVYIYSENVFWIIINIVKSLDGKVFKLESSYFEVLFFDFFDNLIVDVFFFEVMKLVIWLLL